MTPRDSDTTDADRARDQSPADGETASLSEGLASSSADPESVRALLGPIAASDAASAVGSLADERAREVLLWLPPEQSASILAEFDPARAAALVAGLPSDERADLLSAVEEEPREAIQRFLPARARRDAARLLAYPPDSAGGLMETEFLAFPEQVTVRDAIRDLRSNQQQYATIGVQYLYLQDETERLVGLAPIRDLILSPEEAPLASLARREPVAILDTAPLHDVVAAFEQHPFLALPVVNERGVMLGVINRADATEGEHEEAEDDYRVSQGIVGGEELRSMPVLRRARRRSAWLGINLILCLGGAAVVVWHQDTIAKAAVVAAVLPVISATSGNAAMQAAAVSIRELTLGVIDTSGPGGWWATWRRVLVHEVTMALLLALPLGAAVAVLARLWGAPMAIGAAAGMAMAANTVFAIGMGAVCPLALRRLGIDPALASGPIATTLSDISGFALTLSLVSMAE